MNAKEEFLEMISNYPYVKCARIVHRDRENGDSHKEFLLKINYDIVDFEKFTNDLDFEYDEVHGFQEIYGTVWFEGNVWVEREEYNGMEWWEARVMPVIPDKLRNDICITQ